MITSYDKATAITPHDTNPNVYAAIYVGGAGNVTVITKAGETVLFTAPPVGSILPVATSVVKATGTTATALVGLNG